MKLYVVTREIFYALALALVIFTAMEAVMPNIVQAYINVNLVLILWLTAGILTVISSKNI